ncbi:MAG TPA: nucleoside-diphosphate kinase [Candidatus Doudnabacteria bacterium]|nr:nucleoside-diphosphate kinase [Candidatus Doudnabacteria bacterium]
MDLAVIVIKPDSIRDILEKSVMSDLMQVVNLEVVFAKYHHFTQKQVELMYPKWVDRPVFKYMVKNYLIGPSLVLLVLGVDVSESINIAKGKMNVGGGIRNKYKRYSIEEMEKLSFSEEQINIHKSENRIHSTDTTTEAWDIMSQICNIRELNEVSHYFKMENQLTFDLIR